MGNLHIVKCLAALAQDTRLQIYRTLVVAGPEGRTPRQLAESLDLAATTLSFHLKELSNSGLISHRRESRSLYYNADFVQMNRLVAYLTENCCAGQSCEAETVSNCEC